MGKINMEDCKSCEKATAIFFRHDIAIDYGYCLDCLRELLMETTTPLIEFHATIKKHKSDYTYNC